MRRGRRSLAYAVPPWLRYQCSISAASVTNFEKMVAGRRGNDVIRGKDPLRSRGFLLISCIFLPCFQRGRWLESSTAGGGPTNDHLFRSSPQRRTEDPLRPRGLGHLPRWKQGRKDRNPRRRGGLPMNLSDVSLSRRVSDRLQPPPRAPRGGRGTVRSGCGPRRRGRASPEPRPARPRL
jgi:hypothetical protein